MPRELGRALPVAGLAVLLSLDLAVGVPAGARDPEPPVAFTASELLPFVPRRARFRMTEIDTDSREVDWSRLPASSPAGAWRVEVPGVHAALLERAEDGGVWILTHWDYRKGHRIEYDPPALLLPARLEPGGEYRSESDVVVYAVESGWKTASGTCVHRVHLVGRKAVETPAGRFEAVRVDLARAVDVPIADAEVTLELAFVPGRGRVIERSMERVRFFGFGGDRKRRSLELVAEEGPESP